MLRNLTEYKQSVFDRGVVTTWNNIINEFSSHKDSLFKENDLGTLYELGLAIENNDTKKNTGVFYTPCDVANLIAKFALKLEISGDICDVACGCGNLIVEFIKEKGIEETKTFLKKRNIHIYDSDTLAINICKRRIIDLVGVEFDPKVIVHIGDFLDRYIVLPEMCTVISNPPYAKIDKIKETWENTQVVIDSKDYYAAFFEKILKQSKNSVIISPHSFVGSKKFHSLRLLLNNYSGEIYTWDNVPGNIFHGIKQGYSNTNISNSVRATITVTKDSNKKGYKVSPYIRFKSSERHIALDPVYLSSILPSQTQKISINQNSRESQFIKCPKNLYSIYKEWLGKSNDCLRKIINKNSTNYKLSFVNTCRYYTVATVKNLQRTGKYELSFSSKENLEFAYCFLNSSFAYLYWRIFDGGITYTRDLLNSLPIFNELLNNEQQEEIHKLYLKLTSEEEKYLTYKKNAGKMQESVSFPQEYINELDDLFLNILSIKYDHNIFNEIHSNCINNNYIS